MNATASTSPDFRVLKRAQIVRSKTNPRTHFDAAYITEMGKSLAAHGFLQPILVRPLPAARLQDTFEDRQPGESLPTHEIVCGECRFRGAGEQGIDDIPVMVRDLSDIEVLQVQLVENLRRKDLHPLEEAEGFERLMKDHGMTVADIAARVDKSESQIYVTLKLLDLTSECKQQLYSGHLNRSTALLVARAPAYLQANIAQDIMRPDHRGEPMSYRQAVVHIQQRYMLQLKSAVFNIKDANLVPAAGACTACPKRTGANGTLFEDVTQADTCTDPKCFDGKKVAHHAAVAAKAEAKGQTVIQDKEAREILPHAYSKPKGYKLLDDSEYINGTHTSLRRHIGKEHLPTPVLIVNPHTQELQEALPEAVANKLLKAAGKRAAEAKANKPLTEEQLQTRYEDAWRRSAVAQVHAALMAGKVAEMTVDIARHLAIRLADWIDHDHTLHLAELFDAGKVAARDGVQDYLRHCPPEHVAPILLLALMYDDFESRWDRNDKNYPAATLITTAAGVEIEAIQEQVKAQMKAEAEQREADAKAKAAASAGQPDNAKPALKPSAKPKTPGKKKTTAKEAAAGISQAMQAAEHDQGTQQEGSATSHAAWPFPIAQIGQ